MDRNIYYIHCLHSVFSPEHCILEVKLCLVHIHHMYQDKVMKEAFILIPQSSLGTVGCDIEVCTTLQEHAFSDHH